MAISRDEIDKYIFDPENPKQCKSYNLLLKLTEKDAHTYISKEFFLEIFVPSIIVEIEKKLWDIPSNYKELSKVEVVDLYIKQFSWNEFFDVLDELIVDSLNSTRIFKNIFLYRFEKYRRKMYIGSEVIELKNDFKKLFVSYEDDSPSTYDETEWNNIDRKNKILLYTFDSMNVLAIKDFFQRSTILITTLEYEDEIFNSNISENIVPLFLKKIEDITLLLNVLEQDLKKEKQKTQPQESISTIDKVNIENFFSIKDIKLNNLKEKKEIYIVGENGDGKSLFLQAIAIALSGVKEGDVFDLVKSQSDYKLAVLDSDKKEYTQNSEQAYNYILAYGASRNNYCQMKEDETGYLTLFKGEYDLKSPIKWLQYLDYSEKSNKENILTVEEAKALLQHLLNSDIEIDVSADKVTFTEKGSEVSFEQLSAGYKGVITIICDLIARLSEKQQVESLTDFQAVVLIDEVELHLHPKWKYNFMKKLRDIFPLIQFIVTTHSPTVILGASKEAVFYKIYKEDGEVKISNQIANEGYTHNSLISSPLFDLDTITSRDYEKRRVSSDDYVYDKIHQVVSERIKKDVNISEDEIMKLINEELDKL